MQVYRKKIIHALNKHQLYVPRYCHANFNPIYLDSLRFVLLPVIFVPSWGFSNIAPIETQSTHKTSKNVKAVTLAYLEKCFTLNLMTVPSSQGGESRTSVISVHSRSVPSDGCNKTRARTNDRSGIPNNSAAWSVSLKDNGSCTVTGSWNSTSLLHRILSIGPANISLFLNSLLRNSCIYKQWRNKIQSVGRESEPTINCGQRKIHF